MRVVEGTGEHLAGVSNTGMVEPSSVYGLTLTGAEVIGWGIKRVVWDINVVETLSPDFEGTEVSPLRRRSHVDRL